MNKSEKQSSKENGENGYDAESCEGVRDQSARVHVCLERWVPASDKPDFHKKTQQEA